MRSGAVSRTGRSSPTPTDPVGNGTAQASPVVTTRLPSYAPGQSERPGAGASHSGFLASGQRPAPYQPKET